ncbi:MAG: hypothetical protein ACW99F_07170 [Candidatus Hodarchaeales archaeon]
MSLPTKKLPGTSYSVQLHRHPTSKNGKISLIKGKWSVAEKICPALDFKTVISTLEDIILSEGFELNPRILSRIVGELLEEMSEVSTTPVRVEESSELIEIEEHTPPTVFVHPSLEETVTPPAKEVITSPSITTTKSETPIEDSNLSEETFEHIQVLKTQIKELHTLLKDIYEKFDALTIIAEKLED